VLFPLSYALLVSMTWRVTPSTLATHHESKKSPKVLQRVRDDNSSFFFIDIMVYMVYARSNIRRQTMLTCIIYNVK